MRLGEICLLTRDVSRLAAFYAALLGMNTATDDPVHQTIMAEETMLTILHDDHAGDAPTASIAFSVEDVEAEYRRLQTLGMTILQPPEKKTWTDVRCICEGYPGADAPTHRRSLEP